MNVQRSVLLLCLLAGFLATVAAHGPAAVDVGVDVPQVTADDVHQLIINLGAEEFGIRERAQAELSKLGLIAFESLEEVRDHDDFEIRVRVRRLLDALRGPLILAPDMTRLQMLLSNYTELDEEDRGKKIEEVGQYDPQDALPVLTRFARFEESLELAKIAAVTAMQLDLPDDPNVRTALAGLIRDHCGLSKRTSVGWLKAYADSVMAPEKQLDRWQAIQEQADNDTLSTEVLRGLSQVHMDVLARAGEEEAAFELANRIVDMGVEKRQDIAEVADWVLKRNLLDLFGRFYEAHRAEFHDDRVLSYRLAESQQRTGDAEAAKATAERAQRITPDDRSVAKRHWMWQYIQTRDAVHAIVANDLRDRGFFDWAETEYRQAIEHSRPAPGKQEGADDAEADNPLPSYMYIKSHIWLAEMLHDQQDDAGAGQTLAELVDAVKDNQKLQKGLTLYGQTFGSVKARMCFFNACHYRTEGDVEAEKKALTEGIMASPYDADVLIAMHRVPDTSSEWQNRTNDLIRKADRHASQAIKKARIVLERSHGNDDSREALAQKLNDYAWLVGNTDGGDAQQAIRFSHESLELEPGTAGYLDTLGRCYYRVGDYANAIRYQKQALRRDPHSGQLQRQLALFESARNGDPVGKEEGATDNLGEIEDRKEDGTNGVGNGA